MATLDLDLLLEPLSSDSPCGEDPEYDAAFSEMERAAQGKEEQQYGETIIEAEEPDWREVKQKALDVVTRSKDLRAAVYLAKAALVDDGLTGFRDALALIRGYVDQFWDDVHPQLDPDDDNDPTIRVNTIFSVCEHGTTIRFLRETPLVSSRSIGQFSRRDIGMANNEFPVPDGEEPPDMSVIKAAFQDCDLDELTNDGRAAKESVEIVEAIELAVTNHVGAAETVNLETLAKELAAIRKLLTEQLLSRGVDLDAPPVVETPSDDDDDGYGDFSEEPAAASESEEATEVPAAPVAAAQPAVASFSPNGSITTREAALRALEKTIEYFEKYEPSSPLPLLLRRAQRLSTKSFLEILRDISPRGVDQAAELGGVDPDEPVSWNQPHEADDDGYGSPSAEPPRPQPQPSASTPPPMDDMEGY